MTVINVPETNEERVLLGAKLLDERIPGWADRIDLDEFWMSSSCQCVLGQVSGVSANPRTSSWSGYNTLLAELSGLTLDDGLFRASEEEAKTFARAYGFDSPVRGEWHQLADLWRDEIERRQTP